MLEMQNTLKIENGEENQQIPYWRKYNSNHDSIHSNTKAPKLLNLNNTTAS